MSSESAPLLVQDFEKLCEVIAMPTTSTPAKVPEVRFRTKSAGQKLECFNYHKIPGIGDDGFQCPNEATQEAYVFPETGRWAIGVRCCTVKSCMDMAREMVLDSVRPIEQVAT